MAKKVNSRQTLRSAYDYCISCPKGVDIRNVSSMDLEELNEARTKCANCRSSDEGIYKTDAIATAIKAQVRAKELEAEVKILKEIIDGQQAKIKAKPKFHPYRGGKGETYFKRYSETVQNLRNQGKTQKQISEILGISIASVNKICKKL